MVQDEGQFIATEFTAIQNLRPFRKQYFAKFPYIGAIQGFARDIAEDVILYFEIFQYNTSNHVKTGPILGLQYRQTTWG